MANKGSILLNRTIRFLVLTAGFCAAGFIMSISQHAKAQQLSIEVFEIDSMEIPYLLPNCIRAEGDEGCQVVILKVADGLIADYDDATARIRHSTNNYFQYSRTRTNRMYVISFPPRGGGLKFEVPEQNMIDNTLRINEASPGDIRYFEINTTVVSERLTERRLRRGTRDPSPGVDRDTRGQPERDQTDDEDRTLIADQGAEVMQMHTRHSDRKLILALNYMHFIRNSSNLYRGNNLFNQTNGDGFSGFLHYINGSKSWKIGIGYIESSGNFNSLTETGGFTEIVSHSHYSLFVTYSPVIPLTGNQMNSGYLYADIGMGLNYIDHSYSDIEEFINPMYREVIAYSYNVKDEIMPSIIGGLGFIYSNQSVGLSIGVQYEGIYDYDTEAFLNTFYPRVGINFTL